MYAVEWANKDRNSSSEALLPVKRLADLDNLKATHEGDALTLRSF